MNIGIPMLVEMALQRIPQESPDAAASWTWFQCSTPDSRDSVDVWLVNTKHPIAYEPGTKEGRFFRIVRELAAAKYA